jgi:putative aminopeptidase FrvX
MDSKEFLHKLLTTPSVTGSEQQVQRIVRDHMRKYADSVETDLHGNVIVAINPKAERKVMLAGHCDQIGLMVRHITSDGYLYVLASGGIDVGVLYGARVTVYGEKGPVAGVIGRKPIHTQTSDERERAKNDIEKIWIDIGAKNRKDAEKRVAIGDVVTFNLSVLEFGDRLISSPGLDDKVGLFIVMEALRLCAASSSKLAVGLYAVSTVQEELGLRGSTTSAYGINPEVGIAVDVTHASDNPGNENTKATPCILGRGPIIARGPNMNPVVEKMLKAAAKRTRAPFQPAAVPRPLSNDANSIQMTRAGVATGALGIPNRYMHTQAEVCSYRDVESAIKILAQFVRSITKTTDFRPS